MPGTQGLTCAVLLTMFAAPAAAQEPVVVWHGGYKGWNPWKMTTPSIRCPGLNEFVVFGDQSVFTDKDEHRRRPLGLVALQTVRLRCPSANQVALVSRDRRHRTVIEADPLPETQVRSQQPVPPATPSGLSPAGYPATPEGARAYYEAMQRQSVSYMRSSDRVAAQAWWRASQKHLDELLAPWGAATKAELQAIPKTLEGIRTVETAWRRKLNQGIRETNTVRELTRAYHAWRAEALPLAREEWLAHVRARVQSPSGIEMAQRELDQLFQNDSRQTPAYASYSAPIEEARLAAESAEIAAETERAERFGYLYLPPRYWTKFKSGPMLRTIFDGRSGSILANADSRGTFERTFLRFVEAYSKHCAAYLAQDSVSFNVVEIESGSGGFTTRSSSRVIETIRVEPGFVSKYKEYERLAPRPGQTVAQAASAKIVEELASARELAQPGALQRTAAVFAARSALAGEMRQFLLEQKCDSATIGQFKENLLHIAHGESTVQQRRNPGSFTPK